MKILCLSAYYTPELAASLYLAINTFEKFCHESNKVVIYTPMPTRGIDEKTRSYYKKNPVEVLMNDKLIIHRFPMMREAGGPLKRAFRYFFCGLKHFYYGVKTKDADVMFISSTPPIQGAMAALVKKFNHTPIVYNLQDIFPDSLVGTRLTKKDSLLWKIGRVIEDYTYRNVDKIIVISEDFKQNILSKGVPEDKIRVIYNWVDEQAVSYAPRSENNLFDKYGLSREKFYITYSGNIGLTQNMDMLVEVAKELESHDDIQFVLVGNGAYKEKLETIIKEKKISNIILLPFQPYSDISYVFSLGDVSLVISKPGVGANSVPSKTWSIMSASRPVLASFDENELKTIIDKNNCGIFTKAGDKVAFTNAILKLYNERELCKEMGENGRKYVMENFTKEKGTRKVLDVVEETVGNKL